VSKGAQRIFALVVVWGGFAFYVWYSPPTTGTGPLVRKPPPIDTDLPVDTDDVQPMRR
jgi:hypothetical protein